MLSAEDFGIIQLYLPVIGWVVMIGGLGMPHFVLRFYSIGIHGLFQKGVVLAMSGTLLLIMCTVAIMSMIRETAIKTMAVLILLALATQGISMLKVHFRAARFHLQYNSLVIAEKGSALALIVTALYLWGTDPIQTVFGGMLGGYLLTLFYYSSKVSLQDGGWWNVWPSAPLVKEALKYGLPLMIVALSSNLFANLNRYIVASRLEIVEVGKYAIALTLATTAIGALHQPLFTYLHPITFNAWEKQDLNNLHGLLNKYLEIYLFVGLLVCGLMVRSEDFLISLIASSNYQTPKYFFFILIFSRFVLGVYRFYSMHYYFKKNTNELMWVYSLCVLLNVLASFLLIGPFGLVGIAIASTVTATLMVLIAWFRGRKIVMLRLRWNRTLPALLVALGLGLLPVQDAWQLDSWIRWVDMILTSFGTLVFILLVQPELGRMFLSTLRV